MGAFFSQSPVVSKSLEVTQKKLLPGFTSHVGIEVLWLQSVLLYLDLIHDDVPVKRLDTLRDPAGYLSCLEIMCPQLLADQYKIREDSTLRLEVRAQIFLHPCMSQLSDEEILATNGHKNQIFHALDFDFAYGPADPLILFDEVIWASNVGRAVNELCVHAFRKRWALDLPYQADLRLRPRPVAGTEQRVVPL